MVIESFESAGASFAHRVAGLVRAQLDPSSRGDSCHADSEASQWRAGVRDYSGTRLHFTVHALPLRSVFACLDRREIPAICPVALGAGG